MIGYNKRSKSLPVTGLSTPGIGSLATTNQKPSLLSQLDQRPEDELGGIGKVDTLMPRTKRRASSFLMT
jgi:hypothetical protein